MFPTLAVLRMPSILLEPVLMLNCPPSLPLTRENLALAFGDPNSSLSVTFILRISTPATFSWTDVDILKQMKSWKKRIKRRRGRWKRRRKRKEDLSFAY